MCGLALNFLQQHKITVEAVEPRGSAQRLWGQAVGLEWTGPSSPPPLPGVRPRACATALRLSGRICDRGVRGIGCEVNASMKRKNSAFSIVKIQSLVVSVVVWNLSHNFHFVPSINTLKKFLLRYEEPLAELSFDNSSIVICHL